MSKSTKKSNDYKCKVDNIGKLSFYHKNKLIKGTQIPYTSFASIKCSRKSVNLPSVPELSYLMILPNDLKILLLYYLSRFELLEPFRYPDKGLWGLTSIKLNDSFWYDKVISDFKIRDSDDLETEGEGFGWKGLYLIFTYAQNFGEKITPETTVDFRETTNNLAIPELIDAYANSSFKGDFIKYISNEKTISYVWQYYPQYRKFYIFKLLITNPEYLVQFLELNPKINVSLMDIAKIAKDIGLDQLIEREAQQFYDDLGEVIDEE